MIKRAIILAGALIAPACSGASSTTVEPDAGSITTTTTTTTTTPPPQFPSAPPTPIGPNDAADLAYTNILFSVANGELPDEILEPFLEAADARHAWYVSDLLRFVQAGPDVVKLINGLTAMTGVDLIDQISSSRSPWNVVTNHLIAWDLAEPPNYQTQKGNLFKLVEPRWAPIFDDPNSTIDFRLLNWGGVFMDDRPLGASNNCRRGCIPALDDPALVSGSDGDWYADDKIIFGVTEGDEAVAFPKNIMEVHEMVNITIGGRRFGIPYCTLCGSAQAFYTDEVPAGLAVPILRTSGLLSRSNKVMYDLVTTSAFDTFTGAAVSGALLEAGIVLDQNSVAVSTWGEWKVAHPETSIVAEDGGVGRRYAEFPLQGRDDNGPIFPIGDVDPRLGMQAPVLGVLFDDGRTVAFEVDALNRSFADSDMEAIGFGGIEVRRDGGGFVTTIDGKEIGAHQAFWFAWSQFHEDTLLWPNDA
jgi:hypothetical protein